MGKLYTAEFICKPSNQKILFPLIASDAIYNGGNIALEYTTAESANLIDVEAAFNVQYQRAISHYGDDLNLIKKVPIFIPDFEIPDTRTAIGFYAMRGLGICGEYNKLYNNNNSIFDYDNVQYGSYNIDVLARWIVRRSGGDQLSLFTTRGPQFSISNCTIADTSIAIVPESYIVDGVVVVPDANKNTLVKFLLPYYLFTSGNNGCYLQYQVLNIVGRSATYGELETFFNAAGLTEKTYIIPDIYASGGTTDNPYNPYPTGTVIPNDTGNTTSQSTSGTWTLPFDDISTNHSDVQSVDTGLYRMFGMTKLQMRALADALFSSPSEVGENLVKLIFGSPLEAIISCMEYPFEVSPFGMDDIHFIWDTEAAFPAVNGKALSSEYLGVDFGTITVNRYSGTFYDFEPYTTAELYIPYIGFVPLTPTEIMGATLEIKGWVHLATGEMCVFVNSSIAGIIGTYTTMVGRQLPISSYDFREMYAAIIKTAAIAATGIAAGVNAIPGMLAAQRNSVKAYDKLQEAIGKGGRYPVGALSHYRATERALGKATTEVTNAMSEAAADTAASAITAVATGSTVARNNSFSSGSGRCSPQDCFLRLTYPHQNVPANQSLLGYPVNADGPLSRADLHGYTIVRSIHLQGIPATSEEIGELEQLLMGGVWLP